jgi:hypothetical protein
MIGAVWISVGVLVVLAGLGVMPLRGGTGQHAHAGPGTLSVRQLCENAAAEPDTFAGLETFEESNAFAESEVVGWPTEDLDRGRHHVRNVDMLCHRLAVAILEHGVARVPVPVDVCPPRLGWSPGVLPRRAH